MNDECLTDGVPEDLLPEVRLMGQGVGGSSLGGGLLLFVVCLIDRLVETVQGHGTDGVHHFPVCDISDAVGKVSGTVVEGIEQHGYSVAQESEGGGCVTFRRHQCAALFLALGNLRAEGDHVELSVEDGSLDTSRLCLYDSIAIQQLGVVEFRAEIKSRGTVHQSYLGVVVEAAVPFVEGRQHMTLVEGDIVDVRSHIVDECRHGSAVLADGAAEHLTFDVEVVDIVERQFAVCLTDILTGVFCQHVGRRDEPKTEVTFLHVEAILRVDIVFERLELRNVVIPIFEDLIEDE